MMALWVNLLFMPVCAALSGFTVWAMAGQELKEDRELFRSFVFLLATFMLLYWGTVNTDTVRMHTDPVFRMQTELDAQPVYATLKRVAPDDFKQLEDALAEQASTGITIPEAFLQIRHLLTNMTNERMGFADQKTRIEWGRVTVHTLRELEARDPAQCYQLMAAQPLDEQTLRSGFSAANTRAFQAAVIAIMNQQTKACVMSVHRVMCRQISTRHRGNTVQSKTSSNSVLAQPLPMRCLSNYSLSSRKNPLLRCVRRGLPSSTRC